MTDNKDIEKLIFDSLENLSVTPTETVKKRIDKTMFFQNMIHFHAVKLIIGTSLFTVVTGVVLYFSFMNNSNADFQSSNIQNSKIVEKATVSINNEPSTENKFSTVQNTNILEDSKEKKIASYLAMTEAEKTQTTENGKLSKSNSSKSKKVNSNNIVSNYENNSVKIAENKSNVPNTKANIAKNELSTEQNTNRTENSKEIASSLAMTEKNSSISENPKSKVEIESPDLISKDKISENEKVIDENIISNSSVPTESNFNNLEQTKLTNENTEIKSDNNIDLAQNNVKNEELLNITNGENNIADNNIQTNISSNDLEFEIIYNKMSSLPFQKMENKTEDYNMNLLAIDSNLLKEYLKAQNRWFLDFYWMPSLSSTFYKTDNAEFEKLIEQKNNAVQSSLSYNSFGISGGFFKNNMMIKAGLAYTNLADNYNFSLILNNPTEKTNLVFNNNHYDFEQNGTYYNIDTVGGYYHYTYVQDSIIHLYDSSWVDITDSSTVNMYDSIRFIQYDSLKNKKYLNNYTYFEIPLSFGYRFQYNNFEITPEVGIITGFLYKKEGMNISNDLKNNETYIHTLPYKQLIISGTLAININYNISENLGIFIEPAYRQTIASFFNSSSIIKGNSKSFVVKFGIRKKF